MATIVHLSDLHFGSENEKMIEILTGQINALNPDFVVVSGDFTQRARRRQFEAAQSFLQRIRAPKLLVPGNHDIPLYNIWSRFFKPYEKYKKFISESLEISFCNDKLAILGLNSSTPFRAENGEINEEQFGKMKAFFAKAPKAVKIVIMHHNLIHVKKFHHPMVNHERVIQKLCESNVNIVLSGHLHFPYLEIFKNEPSPLFLITAGTATSTRIRVGDNSFNVLEIDEAGFTINVYSFSGDNFKITQRQELSFLVP